MISKECLFGFGIESGIFTQYSDYNKLPMNIYIPANTIE